MNGFTIERCGADEATFADVFELLIDLHREGGAAPMDGDKVMIIAYEVLVEGMSFIARDEGGAPIGTLGLTQQEFWYARESYITDLWFYVKPEWRAKKVGVEMMRAARAVGDERDLIVKISTNNPDRRPKAKQAVLDCIEAGYVPIGYTIKLRDRHGQEGQ